MGNGRGGGEREMAEIKRSTFSEDDSAQDFEAKIQSMQMMTRKLMARKHQALTKGINVGTKEWKQFVRDNPMEGFPSVQERGDELANKYGYTPKQITDILKNEGYQ